MRIVVIIIEYVRRPPVAVSGQQLAVSNGRPTSHHESLATIFPPLLPNPGGPPDRFRMGRPESLFGPPGTDQREVQGGCQNGQRWLASRCGNIAKCCSEKTPFAGRRPPVAGRSQQAVHRTAFVGDVLKGVPLRAEGFPKRRCQFESVAAERRI